MSGFFSFQATIEEEEALTAGCQQRPGAPTRRASAPLRGRGCGDLPPSLPPHSPPPVCSFLSGDHWALTSLTFTRFRTRPAREPAGRGQHRPCQPRVPRRGPWVPVQKQEDRAGPSWPPPPPSPQSCSAALTAGGDRRLRSVLHHWPGRGRDVKRPRARLGRRVRGFGSSWDTRALSHWPLRTACLVETLAGPDCCPVWPKPGQRVI